ncbi:MAG: alpha/beta hydrolase [Rubrivivax sp.]|nr:MAG: alpha/beta hydrolase [Rubrivivax sp.]
MIGRPDSTTIDGPAGLLEVVQEDPATAPIGLAVIAHPHPQMGGTMDNKVVHTLSKAFVLAGWRAVRFNFRGIGQSAGSWDEGIGEVDDLLAVLAHHRSDPAVRSLPLAVAGFSFGGFIAASASARLPEPPSELVLVSPATRYTVPTVPAHTFVVQGEQDDVVSLASVLDWARPQSLPVTVVPGVGHFFHGQLNVLRDRVLRHLRGAQAR